MGTLGVVGILIAIAIFIWLTCFKNVHLFFATTIASIIVLIFNGMPIWQSYFENYMPGVSNYVTAFLLVLIFGALVGKLMDLSGSALSIAKFIISKLGEKNAILAIFIISCLLTYGGVNVLVVVFVLYPIGIELCRRTNIARQLFLAATVAGGATLTMTCIPGTPSSQNLVPVPYLGTDTFAAPKIGIICTIVMFILEAVYLKWRESYYNKKEIHWNPGPKEVQLGLDKEGSQIVDDNEDIPNVIVAFIPLALTVCGVLVFTKTGILDSTGAVVVSNLISALFIVATGFRRIRAKTTMQQIMKDCVIDGTMATLNVAMVNGFGMVVAATAGYQVFVNAITSMTFNPVVSASLATALLCSITGSSTGGLRLMCTTMAEKFIAQGVNAQVLHRIGTIACGTLDSVPHGGPTITIMTSAGFTHKTGYLEIFITCSLLPIIVNVLACALAIAGVV